MVSNWVSLFVLSALLITVHSLPTGLDDSKKTEQPLRPKVKRSQEILMFGNQQNHQAKENKAENNFSPPAEKRTLSNSGLDDSLSEIAQQPEQPKALPSTYLTDQLPQRERNYEYGKVLVNDVEDEMPRAISGAGGAGAGGVLNAAWELPVYGRYYGEDRRKRSQDSSPSASPSPAQQPAATSGTDATSTTSTSTSSSSSGGSSSGSSSLAAVPQTGGMSFNPSYIPFDDLPNRPGYPQYKRSYPSYYPELRYKRELDLDPEDLFALLSLYDNERRNRENWRNYGNDEYDSIDDESNVIGIDDEDPRVGSPWPENSGVYSQRRYLSNEPLLTELAALSRSRQQQQQQQPNNYYDLSQPQQQDYEAPAGVQYGTPQFVPYTKRYNLAPPFMSRKRSQNYDVYSGRSGMMNTRSFPSYQRHIFF